MRSIIENLESISEKRSVFLFEKEKVNLKQFDFYEIQKNVEHEDMGFAEGNVFSVALELL